MVLVSNQEFHFALYALELRDLRHKSEVCLCFLKITENLDLTKKKKSTYKAPLTPGSWIADLQRFLPTQMILGCVHNECEYLAGHFSLESKSSLQG